jgi:hypothetical protein
MMAMTDADYQAMEELALELNYHEALKFMRTQSDLTLHKCKGKVDALAKSYPDSVLGKSAPKE